MDPLTAFSLACGVIQVVDFGLQTVSTARVLYKDGSIKNHAQLENLSNDFVTATAKLQKSLGDTGSGSAFSIDPDDQILYDLSTRCNATAKKLLHELDQLSVTADGGRRILQVSKKTLAAIWKAGKIKDLGLTLESYRKALDTQVLISLRARFSLSDVKSHQAYEVLEATVQKLIIDIASSQKSFEELTRNYTTAIRSHISTEVQQASSVVRQLFQDTRDTSHADRVLQSLAFTTMYSRQEGIADAHKETFQWIFDSRDRATRPWHNFRQWLEQPSEIYWIHGQAGSGKSTLMRFVSEQAAIFSALSKWADSSTVLVPSFFFWSGQDADPLQQSILGMLRSITYQILQSQPELSRIVEPTEQVFAWTEKRLLAAMTKLLDALSQCKICLVLDGLDELKGDIHTLKDTLLGWSRQDHVKICVSSRPWRMFKTAFHQFPQLRLQDLTYRDIAAYVDDSLQERCPAAYIASMPNADAILGNLTRMIVDMADGVFLWVKFAVASIVEGLENHDSPNELYERLLELPREIDDMYRYMLARIQSIYQPQAARYMRLLLVQRYSHLSVSLLTMALAFDDPVKKIEESRSRRWTPVEVVDFLKARRDHVITRSMGFLELDENVPGSNDAYLEWLRFKDGHTVNEEDQWEQAGLQADRVRLRFLHRTAFEFLSANEQLLSKMDNGRYTNASALVDLAAAEIRRLQVLPWIPYLARRNLLKEPSWALLHVNFAERLLEKPQSAVIMRLDKVMQRIAKKACDGLQKHEWWPWSQYLIPLIEPGDVTSVGPSHEYVHVARSLLGITCAWNLKWFVVTSFPFSQEDPTRLLGCLVAGLHAYQHRHARSRSVQSRSNELIGFLLQQGADPNGPVLPKLNCDNVLSSSASMPFSETASMVESPFEWILDLLSTAHRATLVEKPDGHQVHLRDTWLDTIQLFLIAGAKVNYIWTERFWRGRHYLAADQRNLSFHVTRGRTLRSFLRMAFKTRSQRKELCDLIDTYEPSWVDRPFLLHLHPRYVDQQYATTSILLSEWDSSIPDSLSQGDDYLSLHTSKLASSIWTKHRFEPSSHPDSCLKTLISTRSLDAGNWSSVQDFPGFAEDEGDFDKYGIPTDPEEDVDDCNTIVGHIESTIMEKYTNSQSPSSASIRSKRSPSQSSDDSDVSTSSDHNRSVREADLFSFTDVARSRESRSSSFSRGRARRSPSEDNIPDYAMIPGASRRPRHDTSGDPITRIYRSNRSRSQTSDEIPRHVRSRRSTSRARRNLAGTRSGLRVRTPSDSSIRSPIQPVSD